jgi:hypothetical protein
MTMHLLPPMFSTTGKKRTKAQFRTADQARRARQSQESWADLKQRWDIKEDNSKPKKALYTPPQPYRRDTGPRHESKPDTVSIAVRPADKVYTGDAMIGISVLHKSNGIPVFRDEDIKDISKMRRG